MTLLKNLLFCKRTLILTILVLLIIVSAVPNMPSNQISEASNESKDVFVMYAGSLVRIMQEDIGPSFQNQTGFNFLGEGKGSVQLSNLIIDGFRRPDVFVSADTLPIETLIGHDPPLARWYVKFASAELVIAYNPKSPFVTDLESAAKNELPWYEVLKEENFKFGRTDPELDPKGYYTVLASQLANSYYNDSTIKEKVIGGDRNSEQIFPEEVLRSLLESGQIDAIAAYKHEAISRELPYITLPPEVSLSDPKYSSFYKQAHYVIKHSNKTVVGNPIYFSYTVPTTVRNMDGAISFANFLTSPAGKQVLEKVGLKPITASFQGNITSLPQGINFGSNQRRVPTIP
jgi:molybdate/tungstate transport system substrate-binding protein